MSEYKPQFVVFDVETEENGVGSTEFYRADFRVSSAAFSWLDEDGVIESSFIIGEGAVGDALITWTLRGIPLVCHNIQFEKGVVKCRYPEIYPLVQWHADTMRLVQVYDNGGDADAFEFVNDEDTLAATEDERDDGRGDDEEDPKKKPKIRFTSGLGLVKACRRILKMDDHKKIAHTWLRDNVPECKKGKEGGFLNKLPPALLEQYNIGDTEATLKLYLFITDFFKTIDYDWTFDHSLFLMSVDRIVQAKIDGVPIDRESLAVTITDLRKQIDQIAIDFRARFEEKILKVERLRLLEEVRARKTLRGRKKYVKRVRTDAAAYAKDITFNIGSNKQLEALFITTMGLVPKFFTDKGAPSFRSSVLGQFGEGGEMLKTRRKLQIVLKQSEALMELSAYDGHWHHLLRAAGTSTGRYVNG